MERIGLIVMFIIALYLTILCRIHFNFVDYSQLANCNELNVVIICCLLK
jgi:hypothetical protein